MEPPRSEKEVAMKDWIRRVQSWIEENSSPSDIKFTEESSLMEDDNDTVLDTILCVLHWGTALRCLHGFIGIIHGTMF